MNSTKKYKTLEEERDEEFNRIFAEDYTPPERHDYGTHRVNDGDQIFIHKFCPMSGCNVFHANYISTILYRLRLPHELRFIMDEGRTHYCQFDVDGHLLDVRACGYGTGDFVQFSKSFPDKMEFDIAREMALYTVKFDADHYAYAFENYETGSKDMWKASLVRAKTFRELIWGHARSFQDLQDISEVYGMIMKKDTYDRYKREKKSGKETFLGREYDWDKMITQFDKDWSRAIDENLFFNLYKKEFKKLKEKAEKDE